MIECGFVALLIKEYLNPDIFVVRNSIVFLGYVVGVVLELFALPVEPYLDFSYIGRSGMTP